MRSLTRRKVQGGFTLLELMVAAVVMSIVFMGFLSAITASFMATNMANTASKSQATARRLMEEALELQYGDILLLNGSATLTTDGYAAKYQAYETKLGLLTIEVEVCKPTVKVNATQLALMTMSQFHGLSAADGSRVKYSTLTTGQMPRLTLPSVTK